MSLTMKLDEEYILKILIIQFRNYCHSREISGSHGGEYEDDYLLECCAV
jgi:hypothetical protein